MFGTLRGEGEKAAQNQSSSVIALISADQNGPRQVQIQITIQIVDDAFISIFFAQRTLSLADGVCCREGMLLSERSYRGME